MNEIVICENCGNTMAYFQEEHTCGWSCPACGNGDATSYFEPIELDRTKYTISIEKQNASIEAIKISAKVFSCNFLESRKGLTAGTLKVSGFAQDILEKACSLEASNVIFQIEPKFPYSINTD